MKKRIVWIFIILVTITLGIIFRNPIMAVVRLGTSKIFPIDHDYIKAREWSGDVSGIIRFDDGSCTLKNDTVFRKDNPVYIIRSLNKHFDEMTVLNLKNNKEENFDTVQKSV